MPVLLLAQGDPEARTLLRRVIEARYAVSPPALENVTVEFKGRVRTKVGPLMTWVPLRIRASFRFPNSVRWDFSARPVGVPVRHGTEAFDGSTYRQTRGKTAEIVGDSQIIHSLRHRLWAMAAVLLTPLGEHFVRLEFTGESSFEATNTALGDTVRLLVQPNDLIEQVQVHCFNPESGQMQQFSLHLSPEQSPVNAIMLPCKIKAFWDDQPYYEVEPVHIENHIAIADEVFTLRETVHPHM